MKKTAFFMALLIAAAQLSAGGNSEENVQPYTDAASETNEYRESLESGKEVRIDLRTGGSITVTGADRQDAGIEITQYGEAVNYTDVSIRQTISGLQIMVIQTVRNLEGESGVDITLEVPRETSLVLDAFGGDITLTNLEGRFQGRTLGGDITMSRLYGESDLETMGGDIELRESVLSGKVSTLGGDIDLTSLQGDIDTSTVGGAIRTHEMTDIAETNQPIRIHTMGGDIDVKEAPFGINGKTMGGNIQVGNATEFAFLDTLGGDITVASIDGQVTAKTMGGNISITMTGTSVAMDRSATLTNLGGDLTLTVPEGLDMDIFILQEISTDDRKKFKINSDFALEQSVEEVPGKTRREDDRIITTATGKTGTGRNRIYLSTNSGNITLKSAK